MTAGVDRPWAPADGAPTFAEGWEADVFATVLAAIERGAFSRAEWTAQLAATTAEAGTAGDPLDGTTAWAQWLDALEALCRRHGTISTALVDERQEAWRRAYERTPHGDPVELDAGVQPAPATTAHADPVGAQEYGEPPWGTTH